MKNSEFKKSFGAFNTPSSLAFELTNRAIQQAIIFQMRRRFNVSHSSVENIINSGNTKVLQELLSYILSFTILDGSVGQGEFIITSYHLLLGVSDSITQRLAELGINKTKNYRRKILNNLYGMEINSRTLLGCQEILKGHSWDIDKEIIPKWMKNNLVRGNFLESDFTSWKKIPENFPGFDLIIGNPPWGSQLTKEERAHYFKKFKLSGSRRNLNSFELFVYQSTYLLRSNSGYLALYLPKNLTRSNQYANLRKFILHNYRIKSLFFHDLFEHVTQEFISIVALFTDKIKSKNEILVDNEERILQTVYMTNTDYIFTNITDKTSFQVLDQIKKNAKGLEEYVTIQRGEELSKKGGVMYCNFCTSWVPLSSRKPRVECPQCHEILDKSQLLIQFLINPSKSSEHITPILTGDDFNHYYIKSTHFFNDTIEFKSKKNRNVYKSPKIVLQKIKQFPCAAIDLNNTLTTQNVYNIRLKEQWRRKPIYLYYILAILNSSLMHWYYENQFNLGSKYTNAISIKNLKRLPIRPPEDNEKILGTIETQFKNSHPSTQPRIMQKDEIDDLILELYECSSYKELLLVSD